MPGRLVPLGEIVATHGIEGWLRLKPYNPGTTLLSSRQNIFLEKGGVRSPHVLEAGKPHKGLFLLKLQGIDRIDDAQKWVGFVLAVEEEALDVLGPGEYYQYQVVGLEVFDLKGKKIGVVTRVWSKPGGDLYVVQGESKEHLIPAVKEIIEKIDFAAGKMIVDLPEGLLDL